MTAGLLPLLNQTPERGAHEESFSAITEKRMPTGTPVGRKTGALAV